ncbi:MAG: DUF2147 domain-containing protein [Alphaproteobacteria bacterium]|nr:DUF2147 domain-containing protein [Alphaproteobacteria bacterium]
MLDRAVPAAAFALALGAAAWAAPQPDRATPVGRWLTGADGGVIEIAPCGAGDLCGRIVGITRDHPGGPGPTDVHGQPQCGLTIISAAKRSAPDAWTGTIEDPRNGKRYHARLWLDDAGRLNVRGYVGLPVFGETVVWQPFAGEIGARCDIVGPEPARQALGD